MPMKSRISITHANDSTAKVSGMNLILWFSQHSHLIGLHFQTLVLSVTKFCQLRIKGKVTISLGVWVSQRTNLPCNLSCGNEMCRHLSRQHVGLKLALSTDVYD